MEFPYTLFISINVQYASDKPEHHLAHHNQPKTVDNTRNGIKIVSSKRNHTNDKVSKAVILVKECIHLGVDGCCLSG